MHFESCWLLPLSPCSFEVPKHIQVRVPFDLQCLSLAGRALALLLLGFQYFMMGLGSGQSESSGSAGETRQSRLCSRG